jgi:hypothetical protein
VSTPFGGHPSFAQYIAWAESEGCSIKQGVANGADGRPYSVTQIIAPDGKHWVTEVGMQHSDYLVPTAISRLDRRLGMKSPFMSFPHPEDSN